MKTLPLSPCRLLDPNVNAIEYNLGALQDNMFSFLERAAALAAVLEQIDPASDAFLRNKDDPHPVNSTARTLWLDLQDARTYLEAWAAAQKR
jgi:hypothetical protein